MLARPYPFLRFFRAAYFTSRAAFSSASVGAGTASASALALAAGGGPGTLACTSHTRFSTARAHACARYGAIAGASVLIVIGLLVALNYLSARRNVRWDLTENRIYSLSDQTVQLLHNLDAPVRFLVFDVEANSRAYRMLNEYQFQSNLVDVEYVDPDLNPARSREYEIDTYGTVIIESVSYTHLTLPTKA